MKRNVRIAVLLGNDLNSDVFFGGFVPVVAGKSTITHVSQDCAKLYAPTDDASMQELASDLSRLSVRDHNPRFIIVEVEIQLGIPVYRPIELETALLWLKDNLG
jgi:hypothetical protein